MGSKSSKHSPQQTHPLQSIPIPPSNFGRFPLSFAVYFGGKLPESKDECFYLTQGNPDTGQLWPLNIAVVHKGARVKHQITLHSGPRRDSAPLALAGAEKAFRSTSIIALPAYSDGLSVRYDNQLVKMVDKKSLRMERCTFELMVGQPRQERVEHFEWTSDDLWKPQPGKPFQRELVRLKSTGEREVIGAWAKEMNAGESSKLGEFYFLGSGATGELGPCSALMAVASLIRLSQMSWEAAIAADHMIRGAAKLASFGTGLVI